MRAAERDLEAQGSGSDADRPCGRRGESEIEARRYSVSLCRPIRGTVDSVTSAASDMGLRPGERQKGTSRVGTQPLVLVADDEPRITKLVSMALSDEGFRVVTAAGGEEALAKAEEVRPDIVLLDVVMPDLDGIEVMRQLRERRPVPVILLTAGDLPRTRPRVSILGPTTTSPNHSTLMSWPPVSAPCSAGPPEWPRGSEPSGSTTSRSIWSGAWSTALASWSSCREPNGLLLQHLATNAGKVVLHTELLTKVWGPEYRDDLQYLRVWVSRVRRKLGARPGEPGRIKTFQGIGYLLDAEPARVDVPADGAHDHLAPRATAGTGQEDAV
jgi:two-component system KDP operon response regulator KdpE